METSQPRKSAFRIQRSAADAVKKSNSENNDRTPPEQIVCPTCSAVLKKGTWVWASASGSFESRVCPACEQIATNSPRATVFIPTEMVSRRRQEVFALVRNIETIETQRNPLERIIKIYDDHKSIIIETTSEHIAQHIAFSISTITHATTTTRYEDGRLTLVVA